ncbi:MAG: RluA family pseudouridine synthase [Betaproteobacteria bacterium]|nr:RluA family pseudouridine synthase [Betaproteobacteria bacterium]
MTGVDYIEGVESDRVGEGVEPAEAAILRFEAAGGAGERADRFLVQALAGHLAGVSRSRLQQWFALGAIWCEQRTLGPATRLGGFETLFVQPLPREADEAFQPDPLPLGVLHEDADCLVIAKPAGLVVHPAPGHWRGTLLNGLLHHRPRLAGLPRAGIVHRLDKDTSGLLVVAASERGLAALGAQLADRSMSRRYLALAAGLAAGDFTVDAPIGRDPRHRTRMAVVSPEQGRPARTHAHRLAVGRAGQQDFTAFECRLETGRTHQIRVHLRHAGHPLAGDVLYGGPDGLIGRQALHAWRLGFQHPDGRGPVAFLDPPPADLIAAAAACGIDLPAAISMASSR